MALVVALFRTLKEYITNMKERLSGKKCQEELSYDWWFWY